VRVGAGDGSLNWLDRGEKWAVILATLVAIVGLTYTSCRDTRAIQIEQRAWIGVAQWELDREPEDGETITVRTTLINKGSSPAFSVVIKSRLSVLASPVSDDWEGVPGQNSASLFPDASGNGFNKTITIEPGTAAAYRSKRLKIWITGRISYEDAFGRPHWTTFCASHNPEQNLQLFDLCETGNDLDREEF
jgi:hypothetical protein